MRSSTKHRTGFAMITAIMLLSLTAMTITLFGVTLSNQARRTQFAVEDAQLRQLLTAGTALAQTRIQSDSSGRFSVALPDALTQNSAELTVDIHAVPSGNKIAEVNASLPHHRLSQQLTFSSQNGVWQMTQANLGL
jgi:type II secretory pathway component PulK